MGTGTEQTTYRPRIGVVKFASCDGCQLTLLDLEDYLLAVAERFDIVEFAEATTNSSPGPYDVLFVEGSVSTPEQRQLIRVLRDRALSLITIGACATAGGIQALRNWSDHEEFHEAVYAHPEYVSSLTTSTPISEHVRVDYELRGCPVDGSQLLELVVALAVGRRPGIRDESVCVQCKRRGTVCVMVAGPMPCLGPVTHAGCGAICPAYGRGCYGCFGPKEHANTESLTGYFEDAMSLSPAAAGRLFAGFTAYSEPFRDVVTELGGVPVHRRHAGLASQPEEGDDASR